MRDVLMAAAGLSAALIVSGCAKSDSGEVTKTIAIGDFHTIALAGSHEVDVRTGSGPSVRIQGPQRAVDRLEVEVRGDELRIHSRKGSSFSWGHSPKLKIAVTVPALDAATVAGSGKLSIDRVSGEAFKGAIAGSASLAVPRMDVRTLALDIAGSGDATVGGNTERATYTIAGSGKLDGGKLKARDIKLTIAGSGNVSAQASGTVSGDIMGSGSARITGRATCTVRKMGSGSIDCS